MGNETIYWDGLNNMQLYVCLRRASFRFWFWVSWAFLFTFYTIASFFLRVDGDSNKEDLQYSTYDEVIKPSLNENTSY